MGLFRGRLIAAIFLLAAGLRAQVPATLTVNAGATLTSFVPVSVFGINVASWRTKAENTGAQAKVQAAGNFLLRWPGGSADDTHWNGKGSFNANGYWVPDDTAYLPGFQSSFPHVGTTNAFSVASHLTDGNGSTTWLSNVDTDLPNAQWFYLDLGASRTMDAVTILWGDPYAAQFTVQYWDPTAGDQWAPYLDTASHWLDTTAAGVAGTGGTQGVAFTAVTSQYLRVLLTAASGTVTADLGSVTVTGPAYAVAEVRVYQGPTQVSVNNAGNSVQTKGYVSSMDPASGYGWAGDLDFESFMAFARSFSPYVPPVLSVNLGTGTPQEAAAWVHYANIVQGYGIKYWQVGNEIEGEWEWGGPLNTRDYARRYAEYYEAMKAVDPSIVLTGPVAGNPYSSSDLYDGKTAVQDFISILNAQGKASYVDALDFHWYPTFQSEPAASVLSLPAQIQGIASTYAGYFAGTAVDPQVPVLMSEYNSGTGGIPFLDQWANGLFLADSLGQFTLSFGPRGLSNFFGIIAGDNDTTDSTRGDLGYLQVESGPYQYQERGTYWAYRMAATGWARSADTVPNPLVMVNSSRPLLTAYAADRPDHVLSLMVVNKDPSNAYSTALSITGFTPDPSVQGLTYDPSHYAWDTSGVPYHANPDLPPSPVTLTASGGSLAVTFAPYSLTVLHFTEAGYPTPTPTALPATATPTSTPTASPADTHPPNGPVILYPNPVTLSVPATVHLGLDAPADVRVRVYTTSLRKVLDLAYASVPAGQDVPLPVKNGQGVPLANGLYYVTVETSRGLSTLKWLVLR
ncbi:MAG TPA: discoidin domain-containing protein [bacterium]|nr:discoidin domain-containing protein [bacterium]